MELGRVLAGYSLGQADLLRRAMGKKIKAEMDAQQAVFIEGAKAGWVEATTDDGRTVRMHRKTKVKAVDGRMITLEEAMAEGVEVDL
jgi:DNA polymerase-3 subunit alpha